MTTPDGYLVVSVCGSSCTGIFGRDEGDGAEIVDTGELFLNRSAPAVTAFVLYVQGSNFNTSRFTVTAESPDGTTVSTSRNIVGNGGAQGVAFWTDAGFTLTSVEIVNPTGSAGGFAIGEFSYAVPAPGAIGLIWPLLMATRRRRN